ncbi:MULTISPECIES: hypothetical protein [Photorhabdus]|uniref:hypothetical protein n=1 Tax=Photorhabdus TaxID=29487 RepID=UPI00130518F4|nr:hypothetical protein [Photorhabdus asymbiotica]
MPTVQLSDIAFGPYQTSGDTWSEAPPILTVDKRQESVILTGGIVAKAIVPPS